MDKCMLCLRQGENALVLLLEVFRVQLRQALIFFIDTVVNCALGSLGMQSGGIFLFYTLYPSCSGLVLCFLRSRMSFGHWPLTIDVTKYLF